MADNATKAKRGFGAMSLFGLLIVVASVFGQMISVTDPNAPIALVYEEPIYPAVTEAPVDPARQLGGPDANAPAVEVLGAIEAREDEILSHNDLVDGVVLGEWTIEEDTIAGRYLLSQTTQGLVLIRVESDGVVTEQLLIEEPYPAGRMFYFSYTDGDHVILGDDGSLSFGDTNGVWSVTPAQP